MSDHGLPPRGKFERFRKFVSATTALSVDAVSVGVKRMMGHDEAALAVSSAEKWVSAIGEMKGLAMKLGQVASMDVDVLSPEVRAVLSKLQNQAPSMSWATVESVFREEFQTRPQDLFAAFDSTPMAAASLGQVHRARLKNGQEVAVKVQYPGMAEVLEADLANVGLWVGALAKTSRRLNGKEYFEELKSQMLGELNYLEEAERLRGLAEAAAPFSDLKVPQVFSTFTSRRILTMEWLPGRVLKDVLQDDIEQAEKLRITRLLIRALYGPFIFQGCMHADPHPGNFLVMPDGRLGLLDGGSTKQFSSAFMSAQQAMFESAHTGKPLDVLQVIKTMGLTSDLPDERLRELMTDVWRMIGSATAHDDYDFSKDETIRWVKELAQKHSLDFLKLRPPQEAVMFFRATSGMQQNLRLLGARGNIRAMYREIAHDVAAHSQ